MDNGWIEAEANDFVNLWGDDAASCYWGHDAASCPHDVALLAYTTRLVGSRPDLAMHGGGNTSLKGVVKTVAGDDVAALFVKASGVSLEAALPSDFVCLDLGYLKKLRMVSSLTDEIMADEFRTRMLRPCDKLPSIETLMHAFLDQRSIVHTHPTAILALTNRAGGEEAIAAALGGDVGSPRGFPSQLNSG